MYLYTYILHNYVDYFNFDYCWLIWKINSKEIRKLLKTTQEVFSCNITISNISTQKVWKQTAAFVFNEELYGDIWVIAMGIARSSVLISALFFCHHMMPGACRQETAS